MSKTQLNVFGGLVIAFEQNIQPSSENRHELNNLKYEIMLHHPEIDAKQKELFIERLKTLFGDTAIIELDDQECIHLFHVDSNSNKIKFAQLPKFGASSEFICLIDANALLKILFNLADVRLLFSNDIRTMVPNKIGLSFCGFEFNNLIRPYCVETNKWEHDVSFWISSNETFSYFCSRFEKFVLS